MRLYFPMTALGLLGVGLLFAASVAAAQTPTAAEQAPATAEQAVSNERANPQAPVDADLLLRGGLLYDGTGAEPVVGDLAIRDRRIVAVGSFTPGNIQREIDCQGLWVMPGFIDLHSHSDAPILAEKTKYNLNYLSQGCTTVVTGNCGSGHVNVKKFYDQMQQQGIGTNVAHLLPHGGIRAAIFGRQRRGPDEAELRRMKELVRQGMADGAWGMTTGLIYVPGLYSDTEELVALAEVVAEHGGIYASHIRGESLQLFESIDEAIEIGRRAKLPVHISHIKASGKPSWGTLRHALGMIEAARAEGLRVTADQYPYTASSTSLEATLLPGWAREGGRAKLVERLQDPLERAKIREYVVNQLEVKDRLQIGYCGSKPAWNGKLLSEIARSEQREMADVVLEIESRGGASVINFSMSEDDVRHAMQVLWVATASDGQALTPGSFRPHPRSYGTFTRKLGHYAVREKVLPVEQAVRSATGLPADILGLADRGYLRVGYWADVTVVDPEQVIDRATYESPFRHSVGVRYVLVGGTLALEEGRLKRTLTGAVLRKGKPTVQK